jgi:hypothetical protein
MEAPALALSRGRILAAIRCEEGLEVCAVAGEREIKTGRERASLAGKAGGQEVTRRGGSRALAHPDVLRCDTREWHGPKGFGEAAVSGPIGNGGSKAIVEEGRRGGDERRLVHRQDTFTFPQV